MEIVSALNSIHPIDDNLQKAIKEVVIYRTLPKGAIILNEGQVTDEVHFIEKGLIRAFYYVGKKEVTSWAANEGRFIWPLPTYLLRRPSRESIQVIEPTTILTIKRQDVEKLKKEYEAFDSLQCQIMERYIILYDLRIQILLLKAEERIEAYQRLFPELYQRIPLRYIASYLGIDPATLSRIRGNYRYKSKLKKD